MSVLPACMYGLYIHTWYLRKSRKDIRFLKAGAACGYEPKYGCWKSNGDPLQGPQVFLTDELSFSLFVLMSHYETCLPPSWQGIHYVD